MCYLDVFTGLVQYTGASLFYYCYILTWLWLGINITLKVQICRLLKRVKSQMKKKKKSQMKSNTVMLFSNFTSLVWTKPSWLWDEISNPKPTRDNKSETHVFCKVGFGVIGAYKIKAIQKKKRKKDQLTIQNI